jgi:hypothetical protein
MIVEVIIGSVSAVVCAKLWLTNAREKRKFVERERDHAQEEEAKWGSLLGDNDDSGPTIYPFELVTTDTRCIWCGTSCATSAANVRRLQSTAQHDYSSGPRQPGACPQGGKCAVPPITRAHLHMECTACGSKWLMEPSVKVKSHVSQARLDASAQSVLPDPGGFMASRMADLDIVHDAELHHEEASGEGAPGVQATVALPAALLGRKS